MHATSIPVIRTWNHADFQIPDQQNTQIEFFILSNIFTFFDEIFIFL